jgi:hypothetical protein
MNKTLSAYTAPTGSGFPPYLNFALDGDEVVVTLREPPFFDEKKGYLVCGETATMRMPVGEFWILWREGMRELGRQLPAVVQH